MARIRPYGAATTVRIPLLKSDGSYAVSADWTPAAGDVKVSKNGGAEANITTLPTNPTGKLWEFSLSATEMSSGEIVVIIEDAALTSDSFVLETMGTHPDAFHKLGDRGTVETTVASISSQTVGTLTSGSPDDDAYNDWVAIIEDASTAYQVAVAVVQDYVGSTKTYTLAAAPGFTIQAGDLISLKPPRSVSGGTAGPTAAAIADAVWDEATADHVTAGSMGLANQSGGGGGSEPASWPAETAYGITRVDN